jgi:anti-sigma regulatory factor (Ser/Thr protein kinase)
VRREVDLRLALAAEPGELSRVRQMVRAIGATIQRPPADTNDMVLAVDEACANVVAHAYQPDHRERIMHVRAHTQADEIVFAVSDNGSPIVEGKSPGAGLGLRLIEGLSDHLEIEGPGENGTRLTIHFHLDD